MTNDYYNSFHQVIPVQELYAAFGYKYGFYSCQQ